MFVDIADTTVPNLMFSKTERQNRELLTLMFVIKKNQ
jgi:hypothetical protein